MSDPNSEPTVPSDASAVKCDKKLPFGKQCKKELGHSGPCSAGYAKRQRPDMVEVSSEPLGLREHIRLVSQRMRACQIHAHRYGEFLELSRRLLELQGLLKNRHDRSENGIRFKDILRGEAKAKREALAKEKENGT